MTLSEDEGLLNSDNEDVIQEKSPHSDNSVTAIVSDDSSSSEKQDSDNAEDESTSKKAKAFSDKDNSWLRLKKDGDNSEGSDMEEEESVEEKVWSGLVSLTRRMTLKWKRRRTRRIGRWWKRKQRRIWMRI